VVGAAARVENLINTGNGRVMILSWDDVLSGTSDAFKLTLNLDQDEGTCSGCYVDLMQMDSAVQAGGDNSDDSGRMLEKLACDTTTKDERMYITGAICEWTREMVCKGKDPFLKIDGTMKTFTQMILEDEFWVGDAAGKPDVPWEGAKIASRHSLRDHGPSKWNLFSTKLLLSRIWWMLLGPSGECGRTFCLRSPYSIQDFKEAYHLRFCQG
jgi:hypothetical protein